MQRSSVSIKSFVHVHAVRYIIQIIATIEEPTVLIDDQEVIDKQAHVARATQDHLDIVHVSHQYYQLPYK